MSNILNRISLRYNSTLLLYLKQCKVPSPVGQTRCPLHLYPSFKKLGTFWNGNVRCFFFLTFLSEIVSKTAGVMIMFTMLLVSNKRRNDSFVLSLKPLHFRTYVPVLFGW